MFLKKNIWLIFYTLVFLGLIYLLFSLSSTWSDIQHKNSEQLSYLNRVFSSSVSSTFDQQEIMLELLGQQLLKNNKYQQKSDATEILNKLMRHNQSIIGSALSDVDGNLIASSSNIDLNKMPNLKHSENTRATFLKSLQNENMVLGRTYFLSAINNWVIPLRKAIRDSQERITGVMIAGIKPNELLPRLYNLSSDEMASQYRGMLIHDESFRYAYVSGVSHTDMIKEIVNTPVSSSLIDDHNRSLSEQLGISMQDLKNGLSSAEYFAPSLNQEVNLFSILYIPKYQLWSLTLLPKNHLLQQLKSTAISNILSFIAIFIVLYFLFRHIDNVEQIQRQLLRDQANHDFLTHLKNRLYLKNIEPEWIHDKAAPFSVFFIDLDNFKAINDSYGHTFGDAILKQVANRLRLQLPDQALTCRQGGDEFIVLCHNTELESLQQIALDILDKLAKPYHVDQYQFSIGASIGICRYPDDGVSFDILFSAADSAMYQAKNKKNNYFIFTSELREQTIKTAQLEQALQNALQKHEFHMVYQPQISKKGFLYGVEALVRWDNSDHGNIPPFTFIPIAESSGLIIELGHFIINQSIRDISEMCQANDNLEIQLSINISVRQFLEDRFIDHLSEALSTYQFPSRQLTLEITESIFIEDFEYMEPLFAKIRALGINLSLDDFGTGYSSLSMLKRLPIDELKIDKSFIDQVTHNLHDKALVLNIMDIAQNLGLRVVAEGIETGEQKSILKEYNCDIQQGYFYSRPLKYHDLVDYCARYNSA